MVTIGPLPLTEFDVLRMPEVEIEAGLAEIYADADFSDVPAAPAA